MVPNSPSLLPLCCLLLYCSHPRCCPHSKRSHCHCSISLLSLTAIQLGVAKALNRRIAVLALSSMNEGYFCGTTQIFDHKRADISMMNTSDVKEKHLNNTSYLVYIRAAFPSSPFRAIPSSSAICANPPSEQPPRAISTSHNFVHPPSSLPPMLLLLLLTACPPPSLPPCAAPQVQWF